MARLIYSAITSLNGYVADQDGKQRAQQKGPTGRQPTTGRRGGGCAWGER